MTSIDQSEVSTQVTRPVLTNHIPGEPEHVQLPPPERLPGGDIALPSLLVHQDLVSLELDKSVIIMLIDSAHDSASVLSSQ